MRFYKNCRHRILVSLEDDGRRAVYNNGIRFTAPEWYQPAYAPLEEISEEEYRYIAASCDWEQPQPPSRNDATMYNDWD